MSGADIPDLESFYINDWRVVPAALRVEREQEAIKVEAKVMDVLVYLARHAGRVVSRQQLESEVWQGVVVGYDSLGSVIIKLRKLFNDDPKNPTVIETVPKRGYRLIAAVTVDKPDEQPVEPAGGQSTGHRQITKLKYSLVSAGIIFFGICLVAWLLDINNAPQSLLQDKSHEKKIKPIVAVLKFVNISNDPQQEYLSAGIASDLITDLSNLSGITVIARNSSFVYQQNDLNLTEIQKELGVDYLVEGSVRKSEGKLRVSAGLIDVSTGTNIWADRFDAELEDMFNLQDEITSAIVSILAVQLNDEEKQQIVKKYTQSLQAYDYFLQGWQHIWKFTREDNIKARGWFHKAIELDNSFARAYANLAVTYSFDYINGWSSDTDFTLQQAQSAVNKAVALDSSLPQVQWAVGIVNAYSKNYEQAMIAAEKAIAHAPNFADGYGLLATVLNYSGRLSEAQQAIEKAMVLNPRHPFIYKVIHGEISFNLKLYEKAAQLFQQALERNPQAQEPRIWLLATYAYLDRMEEAAWELEQLRHTGVSLTIEYIDRHMPLKNDRQRAHLISGLKKAGLSLTGPQDH